MPRRELVQVSLLLLCVPAQYLLSKYFAYNNDSQRNYALRSLLLRFSEWKVQLDSWLRWGLELPFLVSKLRKINMKQWSSMNESPAVEVMQFRGAGNGYFTESPLIRSPRPKRIRFRIGQVVKHKSHRYHGVIIGWDPFPLAPQSWFYENHLDDKSHLKSMPHYLILVDARNRKSQKTYEPEENLSVITDTKIMHRNVSDYFDDFDGAQYIPRPSLRILYPED